MNRLARNGLLSALFISALNATPVHAGLILTGVYDGPLAGGQPKGVALYADTDIADLSAWGPGKASNGDGSTDVEFRFPGPARQPIAHHNEPGCQWPIILTPFRPIKLTRPGRQKISSRVCASVDSSHLPA